MSADRLVRRLKLYPLLLIVDYSFATVNRLYEFIYPDDPLFVLIIIAWSFASISGFFNAIVYGLTPSVRIALRNFCSGDLMAQGDEELILND